MTFKIGFNDIPRRAISSSANSENADYPHENLFYGGKTIFWQSAAAVTSSQITFDLGSGITSAAEYFAVAGLNSIIAQTPGTLTLQLRASTDNFAASDVLISEATPLTSANLIGTYDEDYLKSFTLSTAYRYWRFKITTSNAVYHKLRALYFGAFFDFDGKSPRYPYDISPRQAGGSFISDAGTMFATSSGRAKYRGNLAWTGITDAVRNEFFEKIGRYLMDYPIFFYEPDDFTHTVLPNRILFCMAENNYKSHPRWKNVGEIELQFTEDIIG